MSKGCLMFAFNNDDIDYVQLANASAKNIQRLLGLPVSIITDNEITFDHNFDQVICVETPDNGYRHFQDYDKVVKWINFGRHQAYNLSPYTETLLLDVDYVVSSNRLKVLFELNSSLLCHLTAFNVSGQCFKSSNKFGTYNMPMSWATVMYFKKDSTAKSIFDSMQMVQDNYSHYANLYNFKHHPFRNDFALSIALNINSGHFIDSNEYQIPWDLVTVVPDNKVVKLNTDEYEITYKKSVNKSLNNVRIIIRDMDLHVMGKSYLREIYES
jgi:hypothetical protein